jgi:hypothetical protein
MSIASLPHVYGGDCPRCQTEEALRIILKLRTTLVQDNEKPPVPYGFVVAVDQVPTVYCSACPFEAEGLWLPGGKRFMFLYQPEMSMQ